MSVGTRLGVCVHMRVPREKMIAKEEYFALELDIMGRGIQRTGGKKIMRKRKRTKRPR